MVWAVLAVHSWGLAFHHDTQDSVHLLSGELAQFLLHPRPLLHNQVRPLHTHYHGCIYLSGGKEYFILFAVAIAGITQTCIRICVAAILSQDMPSVA